MILRIIRRTKNVVEYKAVISDPETGKTRQINVESEKIGRLFGIKISDEIDGATIGFPGYKFVLTGGSDKDGFPMRSDVHGAVRKRILLSSSPGFHPKRPGQRKRRTVRGNMISDEIAQINLKVTEKPEKEDMQILEF
jgi:small subunit ribosomal protein S6e